jgi:hypothetical protein
MLVNRTVRDGRGCQEFVTVLLSRLLRSERLSIKVITLERQTSGELEYYDYGMG